MQRVVDKAKSIWLQIENECLAINAKFFCKC